MVFLLILTWMLKVNGWYIPTAVWIVEGVLLWLKAMGVVLRIETRTRVIPEIDRVSIGDVGEDDLK